MSNASDTSNALRPSFWENYALEDLTRPEWEALCDGCGKCCLLKLEDADTGELAFTNVACRLLDLNTCQCTKYAIRKQIVKDCIVVDTAALERISYWLPVTCAYRLLTEGKPLEPWHPLVCGDPDRVHKIGISLQKKMVSEEGLSEDDLEEYIVEGME